MTATAASVDLVDALKDSLANSASGWAVLAASDVGGLSVSLSAAGVLQSGEPTRLAYRTIAAGPRVIFLTSGTSWTVPDDWDNDNNTIEVIGAGGGGAASGGGGGGGAYSKIDNLALTPGASVPYAVGVGGVTATAGGDTHFNGASFGAASVAAKGGGHSGAAGGAAASGIGSTKYSGGNGGTTGGGGGGSAGPGGNGGNGASAVGGGGGGANGGSAGSAGVGGNGPSGSGGGTRTKLPSNGGGGAGAYYDHDADSGAQQDIWASTDASLVGSAAIAGPGGGGGGGMYTSISIFVSTIGNVPVVYFADPGSGGGYGGGGGGGYSGGIGGTGGPGLIVITYGASGQSFIDIAGGQYIVTDTELHTTMLGLCADFLADTDAAVIDLLNSGGTGPATPVGTTIPASVDLVTAIKDSLADTASQWSVTGRAINVIREASGKGGEGGTIGTAVSRVDHVVTLSSPVIRVAPGTRAPLSFCYIGSMTPAGSYLSSMLFIDGKEFTVSDSDLHTQIMTLAAADAAAVDAAVTDSLALGPQTFGG